MTEKEARAIYHQGEEAVVAKLLEYNTRLIKLEEMLGNYTPAVESPLLILLSQLQTKRYRVWENHKTVNQIKLAQNWGRLKNTPHT